MADLMKDVNYLRYYYSSDDASKEKDFCKNAAFAQYERKMGLLFSMPLAFQCWQISLVGAESKMALYKQVRLFKSTAIIGACALGLWEYSNLRKRMTFYDRFYPEATELQRKLAEEAAIFKEQAFAPESTEERLAKVQDPEKALKYSQFYQLAPQKYAIAEEEFNAPEHEQH